MDNDLEKAKDLGLMYLNTEEVEYLRENFHDTSYSARGWQHKRMGGNSQKGQLKYKDISASAELILDSSKCARNDSDPRYYIKEIYKVDANTIVYVSNDPSRSGKSVSWYYFTVTKKLT